MMLSFREFYFIVILKLRSFYYPKGCALITCRRRITCRQFMQWCRTLITELVEPVTINKGWRFSAKSWYQNVRCVGTNELAESDG